MNLIESKNNPLIKEVKKLHEKKYRLLMGKFIVEGLRFVGEALTQGDLVDSLFISRSYVDKYNHLLDNNLINGKNIFIVEDNIFKSLCYTESPQGIISVCNITKEKINITDGFYILVDKVQDPGNLGTIIRSAHASGAKAVILTKGTVDLYNSKVLRSTMGSIFYIPIIEDDKFEYINSLKDKGFKFLVSSLDTDKNFYDIDLTKNLVICVGNEGNGISEEIYKLSDIKAKIPMPGGAESLNVSIAASIMMFEVIRQINSSIEFI
ncbi:rRNA methylase [Clostridium putrefaciens]|uniref:rRNA methylase n=1 Tax=Clostridium putrefaciens TaxID=99675 RepID=A0A381J7M3_9CLOT|nr:RNA methyltransferase [Clostridium putrefaciens]SUY46989.1 rRNA methylase [Clostridium putrefaciens]